MLSLLSSLGGGKDLTGSVSALSSVLPLVGCAPFGGGCDVSGSPWEVGNLGNCQARTATRTARSPIIVPAGMSCV